MNFYSRWARFSYRTAFIAAAFTYGIVVYKSVRARSRSRQQISPYGMAGDENVQYLGLSPNHSASKLAKSAQLILFSS